jgi:SAM-dependent methyltransferase
MMTSSAEVEGPEWSARAEAWAELWGDFAQPAAERLLAETAVGRGTRLLDIGCGSGELCALASQRGAAVSGLDAAAGMIAIAQRRVPGADLRIGPMERLPWPSGSFDVVTAINAVQFAADVGAAVAEAGRVTRGVVALCNWGPERELSAVMSALAAPAPPGPPSPRVSEPGVLEALARDAGLQPRRSGTVAVPYEAPDLGTLERALLDGAGMRPAEASADTVRRTIADAAAPFRRPDGSYRFENTFLYLVAAA